MAPFSTYLFHAVSLLESSSFPPERPDTDSLQGVCPTGCSIKFSLSAPVDSSHQVTEPQKTVWIYDASAYDVVPNVQRRVLSDLDV